MEGLRYFVEDIFSEEERRYFLERLVPFIQYLAKELPFYIRKPIPLLQKFEEKEILLNKIQVASLLANAFFCTFPNRSSRNGEYQNFPPFLIHCILSEDFQDEMSDELLFYDIEI